MSVTSSHTTLPLWLKRCPCYYGWMILAVSWLSIFASAPGQTYIVSVFVDPIMHETGWSRNLLSGLYTAGSLSAAMAMLLVGYLLDRYGARVILTAVVLAFGGALVWMSRISEPWHLFLGFMALRTLGQGALVLVATTMVTTWFVRKRGRASMLTAFASPASQATFPLLAHALITHLGWRYAWVCLAVMVWGVLFLPAILVVRRSPEAVGLLPDGDVTPEKTGQNIPMQPPPVEGWRLGEASKTRAFWCLLGSSASISLVSTALTFHHVSLFASKGFTPALAAGVLSFMAPMAMVGSFTAGFLADKLPNRFILATALALYVLAILRVLSLASPGQAFLYGGMVGFSQGMLMMVNLVIWPNYFGRAFLGSIRGAASTAMVAAAALGPLPFGYTVTLSGSYNVALGIFGTLPLACIALSVLAVPPTRPLPTVLAH